ncbi:hypothetical protein SAMN04487837_0517 [Streptococcus equinus]|nr:hypothetical protein GO596_05715 [Streptococcus equinus]SCW33126.1 hypothetical protein SAMN02910449_0538 [Streptococcus equinus]SDQ04102.1 hypothetical protein SAMN04487837_0517 [Streptococcus equinus]SDQ25587.1 hypothetical protein SAMN04488495_0856 [Streptococcus equinus]SEN68794.1 hypothetical protein SAMN04488496_0929 [Streptococcus equinus]
MTMKNIIKQFKKQAQAYIDFRAPQTNEVNLKANKIAAIIKEAQEKHLALHAIYLDESFTGDLVKYDAKGSKLILKNFQQNISTIIPIEDIKRLTLVPPTVRKSQLQTPNKK